MKRVLLLGFSLIFLIGCTTPKKEYVYISTPVKCPTIQVSPFEPEIPEREFSAKKINGNICLTDESFVELVWHSAKGRKNYNQLYQHIEEFNELVQKRNEGL